MASVFYQIIMYLLFCCTWGVAFLTALIYCENIYKAVCISTILWSTFLFVLTEGLSFFKAITASNLMLAWGIFLILWGGVTLTRKNLLQNKIHLLKQSAVSLYKYNGNSVKALIIFIAFFMLVRTLLAVITAPTWGDPYHLERVMYWAQHHNVEYYDTCVLRQLFSPVFAEYINLHVFLLTGGDIFANMLQNFSAYGCIFFLYGIIRKLGCGIKWALFGCILALTMNIFCVESLTGMGCDVVSAFYLIALTYLMIEVLFDTKLTIFQFILLGLISGLLYITKTNACAPAAVIIIGIAAIKIFKGNFKIIPLGIISLICILTVVFPTFYRNYQAFDGDFMAKVNVGQIAIGTYSPAYITINIIKNLITIGVERNAVLLMGFMKTLGRIFNININTPEINLGGMGGAFKVQYFLDMNTANAHIVTPLFVIAFFISLAYLIKRRTQKDALLFILSLQMLSILILLRWQICGARLILPALVVVVIPIIYYFREITKRFNRNSLKYKICFFLILDLIFQCGYCSLENLTFHSFVAFSTLRFPRYEKYWGIIHYSKSCVAYQDFARLIDEGNYENIGLDGTEGMYQYPILAKYVPQGKKVECVTLLGESREAKALNPNFSPDIIIAQDIELDPEKIYTCNGNNYQCIYSLIDKDTNGYYSAWKKK